MGCVCLSGSRKDVQNLPTRDSQKSNDAFPESTQYKGVALVQESATASVKKASIFEEIDKHSIANLQYMIEENKADINEQNTNGETPLIYACR